MIKTSLLPWPTLPCNSWGSLSASGPIVGLGSLRTYLSIAVAVDDRHEETLQDKKHVRCWPCVKITALVSSSDSFRKIYTLFPPNASKSLCLHSICLRSFLGVSWTKQMNKTCKDTQRTDFYYISFIYVATQDAQISLVGKRYLYTVNAGNCKQRVRYGKKTNFLSFIQKYSLSLYNAKCSACQG